MKKTLLTIVSVCAAVVAVQAQNAKPAIPRDAALEAKVEKTLAKMTLDEKIGQMLSRECQSGSREGSLCTPAVRQVGC